MCLAKQGRRWRNGRCRNRSFNPEGEEGESRDDGRGKLLDGSWAAGPERRTKDPRKKGRNKREM